MNDILRALDDGDVALIALLDLSAAFDTIDHNILLHRLEHLYGMQDCLLEVRSWMTANKLKLNDDKTEPLLITSFIK